ncbi:unnamed protein product [Discula destructiva]
MRIPDPSIISAWPVPNFTDPETRGPVAIIIVGFLLGLVTLLLAIRIYTRVWISKGFGQDDVLILLAYIPTAAFAIVSFVAQAQFGWGRHIWDIPFAYYTVNLQASLASQLLFGLSTSLTKLSMLALIWRVVSVDGTSYRYVVIAVAIIVSLDGFIFFFVTLFQCSPPEAYWTLSATPQKCINDQAHLLAAGCINTTTDFILVLLPIPCIKRLSLTKKQQIIVASLFGGGLFTTLAGAVRTYVTFRLFDSPDADPTWNAIPIIIVSALELFIGIICASIPPTKPFFARYLPSLLGNPASWLSRNTQTRATLAPIADQKLEPDFWRVTTPRDSTHSDTYESKSPLVLQMRSVPPMRGMPTPTRPPRTQSTMKSLSVREPYNLNTKNFTLPSSPRSSMSSATTASTAILGYRRSTMPAPLNLNKPLPRVRTPSELVSMEEGLDWEEDDARRIMSANMLSIYKLIPHEDGHISVHKTKERDPGQ